MPRPGAVRNPSMTEKAPMPDITALRPANFLLTVADRVATVRLNRPERKNAFTFDGYAELRDFFADLRTARDVRAVVLASGGGHFSSGGDVHDILGPLARADTPALLAFTRMTGDLVRNMLHCGKPVIAAVDGVCAGAGAALAMAADMRLGTPGARTAFLFNRVGLAGCDLGACAMLPRIIGQGRAAELLFTGRTMTAEEGLAWGFFNTLHAPEALEGAALALARGIADGPAFAHSMTKTMLVQEWNMSLDQAIEAEAQAQAICLQTEDFRRACRAIAARETPVFEGD